MTDIYQTVTDRIVTMLENGTGAWRCPWHHKEGERSTIETPINVTGRAYRGINVPLLWATADHFGYRSNVWATYKQWQGKGAQVRKGEKSTLIVFWKRIESTRESGSGDDEPESHLMARAYFVFNADQVDGLDATKPIVPPVDELSEAGRIERAEAFFAATGSVVRHNGNRAYYASGLDHIQMPDFAQFEDTQGYYATLGHEHVHWTGAKRRCDREFGKRFGDSAYAFEELVAELGSAFLCSILGLANEPREDHASYLASWLRVLKSDKRAIFTAASKAQSAVDYLQSLQGAEVALAA